MELKTYKSLDTIPIYNYTHCLNGDFSYMLIGSIYDLPEIDSKQSVLLSAKFSEMLSNHEGKKQGDTAAILKKVNTVKAMQAINEVVRSYTLADDENKKAIKKIVSQWGLSTSFKGNNRIIERLIKETDKRIEENKENIMTLDSLDSQIVALHSVLGVSIDKFTCPATTFFKYQLSANKKAQQSLAQKYGKR